MSRLSLTPSVARGFGLLPGPPTSRAQRASSAGGAQASRPAVPEERGVGQPRDAVAFSVEALEAATRLGVDEVSEVGSATETGADSVATRPAGGEVTDEEINPGTEADAASETSDGEEGEDLAAPRGTDGEPLTDAEIEQVRELQARDLEVRQHEQAHAAVGGPYVTSGPQYEFQQGPDGRRYAVGGNVGIDVSPEATPEETLIKARTVRRAALAPAEPSAQDYRVAAQATRLEQQARTELREQQQEEAEASDESGEASAASVDSREQAESIDFFA